MMTYFKTVRNALDALITGVCDHKGITRDVAMRQAAAFLKNMSEEWRTGLTPTIAYSDPLCRFAYLYCHTAANANICDRFIRADTHTQQFIINKLNDEEEIRVCAFGGGPGTELLALSKLMMKAHASRQLINQGELTFTLLDNVPEWGESWNTLEAAIKANLEDDFGRRKSWPFTISKTFLPFDILKVEQWANLSHLLTQDIYVMNYVISEILDGDEALQSLVNKMGENAPPGARFLIVDRNQGSLLRRAAALLRNAGFQVGDSHTYHSSTNMDSDEQASDLGDYYQQITWSPRVSWSGAFGIVGVKE